MNRRFLKILIALMLLLILGCGAVPQTPPSASPSSPPITPSTAASGTDWPRTARIATPYDYPEEDWSSWEDAIDQAVADGANVILDWACASGNWHCLFDPDLAQDIGDIKSHADYIHNQHPGVHYIIYIAPLEYVSYDVDMDQDGQVDPDKEADSLALQHPAWVQMGISGQRAIFYGTDPGMPFWVCATCEDVWVTPANTEYRQLALAQAARLANSGVDGLWFDVPFLRHTFGEAWTDQWPDVSPEARALFQQQTGLTLPMPPFAPDWNDPIWQAFVAWRYRLIREFVGEYYATLRDANPSIRLIMESSVGFNAHSTQTGASPLDLPTVSDLTAHERGGTERPYQYYRWLSFLAGLLAWRHVDMAHGQPSWLLSYVEAGHSDTVDVARLHGATVLWAGFNYYTSGGEDMTTLVDADFRRQLFAWIAAHESTIYDPLLRPYANIAVVYSQQTLDYRGRGSWELGDYADGFAGMLMMLLESHIPFAVLSERDLARLADYEAAILPDFAAMSEAQAQAIRDYVQGGGVVIATGETSLYDEWGMSRNDYALADLFGVGADTAQEEQVYTNTVGAGRVVFAPAPHEQWYYWAAQPWDENNADESGAESERQTFLNEVWARAGVSPLLTTDAPHTVVFLPLRRGPFGVDVRTLNYTGIGPGDAVPTSQQGLSITLTLPVSAPVASVRQLDFLGGWTTPSTQQPDQDHIQVTLDLSVGGILRVEMETQAIYLPVVRREGERSKRWRTRGAAITSPGSLHGQ